MKTTKLILALLLFSITNANAQFWDKIKKRVVEAAEQTVERKVAEKTERETDKAFDSVFNNNGKLFKNNKTNSVENYVFSHKYKMEVISKKDTTDITYYLTNEHEYMASEFTMREDTEFITVIDLPNSAIHTFMDLGGVKTTNSINIKLEDIPTDLASDEYSVEPTGNTKTIVGYECLEFQVTAPQLTGTVWVTQESDITFSKAFSRLKMKKVKNAKGIDPSWTTMVDGLALEMDMIDSSRKKPVPVKMICTELSENPFVINPAEYKSQF